MAITIAGLLWIIILVLVNGFFVASEFAIVKLRPSKIQELLKNNARGAEMIHRLTSDLDTTLTGIQLGITLASILLGILGEPFFSELIVFILEGTVLLFNSNYDIAQLSGAIHTVAFIFSYIFVSFLHVVIGEIMPKSIAIQKAQFTAGIIAWPLYKWTYNPFTQFFMNIFVAVSNFLLRRLPGDFHPSSEEHHEAFTEDELKIVLRDSIFEDGITSIEYKYIRNILDFSDTTARSVLTSRINVIALPDTCTLEELVKLSIDTGYSRIPIYTESLDDCKHFVHIKDVMPYFINNEKFNLEDHFHEVIEVYQEKSLDNLLKEMKRTNKQLAIVFDEYGSCEGIVTIEDIFEEIFGEVQDEFDEEIPHEGLVEENGKFLIGGLVSIGNFNKFIRNSIGGDIGIESDESVTLAGYVIELCESELPDEGREVKDESFNYKVLKLIGKKIETIEVTPLLTKIKVKKKTE